VVASILDQVWMFIVARIEGLFGLLHIGFEPGTIYLWEWYFWGFVFLLICLLVGYFFSFTWARAILGVMLMLVGAFIAGGRQMHYEMNREIQKSKVKPKPLNRPLVETEHSIFSNWFS